MAAKRKHRRAPWNKGKIASQKAPLSFEKFGPPESGSSCGETCATWLWLGASVADKHPSGALCGFGMN